METSISINFPSSLSELSFSRSRAQFRALGTWNLFILDQFIYFCLLFPEGKTGHEGEGG